MMSESQINEFEQKNILQENSTSKKPAVDNSHNPMYTAEEDFRLFQHRHRKYFGSSLSILVISKFISLFIYGLLYFLACDKSIKIYNDDLMKVLRYLLLMSPFIMSMYGVSIIYAAYSYNLFALNISMILCVMTGVYDMVVAAVGVNTYYIEIPNTVNTVLLYSYCCMSMEMFWVLCNDLPHLIMFKKLVKVTKKDMDTKMNSEMVV